MSRQENPFDDAKPRSPSALSVPYTSAFSDVKKTLHSSQQAPHTPASAEITDAPITDGTIWEPHTSSGAVLGMVVVTRHPGGSDTYGSAGSASGASQQPVCSHCHQAQTDNKDPLFEPCKCGFIHRSCFKKQRRALMFNPASFWQCSICMSDYNMERIVDIPLETTETINKKVQQKIILMWMSLLAMIAGAILVIGLIAWASDKENKNVPVGIKQMMSSLVFGWADANKTKVWREEFKEPDVHVGQYYGLLGTFIVALLICILAIFAPAESTKERAVARKRDCCDDCCRGCNSSTNWWICYWGTGNNCNGCNACCDCGGCNCDCSGGGCDAPKCDGEGAAIVVIVIVVIVIVSAIFVIIGYGLKKTHELEKAIATTIRQQEEEWENSVIVLGRHECLRPRDQV